MDACNSFGAQVKASSSHQGPASDELRTRLAFYLDTQIEQFRVLASGWETTVYEFSIARRGRLAELAAGTPLVLRFYEAGAGADKGRREYQTLTRLAGAHYPVPAPYLYEPSFEVLGAPFLVMERAAGGPLFAARSFPQAFKTFTLAFFGFVRAQATLHRLSPNGSGSNAEAGAFMPANGRAGAPLLDRMLEIIGERIERGPLPGLSPALEALRDRAPRFRAAPVSIVHMDYHPQNVLVSGARVNAVIDWVNADFGDRHLDAATTAVIMATHSLEHPRWMRDNLAGNSLRRMFTMLYIPLYHAMAPLDLARFRYCQAVAAMIRLSTFGMMRARGPESVGYRREAIAEITPAVVGLLTRYAARKSGVSVNL
jgi:aminoglycoside phosphotransferase (APT) family kinase protein